MLGRPIPSRYVIHPHKQKLVSGYLLVDFVEDGRMLSESWETLRDDHDRRTTLFRDMSRVMLSLARVELPRIGSLTMDDSGIVTLTNRPLTLQLHQLENQGISTSIPRDLNYSTTDAYLLDLLECHNNRIRHQPNSILDNSDGESQLSTLVIMRALIGYFTNSELRHGPFIFMLTDFHQSNIFVDDDWHITCLIDLEWACSQPKEMLHPPYWLTSRAIDQLTGEHLKVYQELHKEFMSAFEEEEKDLRSGAFPYTDMMWNGWNTANFWYFSAMESFTGFYSLFFQHIQPLYGASAMKDWNDFERSVSQYWAPGTSKFISEKVKERKQYLEQVREVFGEGIIRLEE